MTTTPRSGPLTSRLLTAGLVALALGGASAAPPAYAEGETCLGRPATLVGSPGTLVEGTSAPDVIVTNGARLVQGRGGGDVVCVTGKAGLVVTGGGDDTVDASGVGGGEVRALLGSGSDTFTGSRRPDEVTLYGDGADAVSAGNGSDRVEVLMDGFTGAPRVDLGAGSDTVVLRSGGGAGATATIVDSDRYNRLVVRLTGPGGRTALLDNAAGTLTAGDTTLATWPARAMPTVRVPASQWAVGYNGSGRGEMFTTAAPLSTVRMGDGYDTLRLRGPRIALGGTLDGGPEPDSLEVRSGTDEVIEADLAAGSLRIASESVALSSFASVRILQRSESATRLSVVGSAQDDDITVGSASLGATVTVDAGAGDDWVSTHYKYDAPVSFTGGPGDDGLEGGPGDDTLLGGDGEDYAFGNDGADRCVAEETFDCER